MSQLLIWVVIAPLLLCVSIPRHEKSGEREKGPGNIVRDDSHAPVVMVKGSFWENIIVFDMPPHRGEFRMDWVSRCNGIRNQKVFCENQALPGRSNGRWDRRRYWRRRSRAVRGSDMLTRFGIKRLDVEPTPVIYRVGSSTVKPYGAYCPSCKMSPRLRQIVAVKGMNGWILPTKISTYLRLHG